MGKKMQLLYFLSSSPSYSSDSYCVPIPGQQFTITWDEPPLSMGELVDAYLVNISSPNFLCVNVNTLQKLGIVVQDGQCPTGQRVYLHSASSQLWRRPKGTSK